MYRFEAIHEIIPEKKRKELTGLFSHELMGDIALEWSELIRSVVKQNHELVVFKIFRDKQWIGIAILSIVRKLKMTQWRPIAPLFKVFNNLDVGFVEIPLSNLSGILLQKDISLQERKSITVALCGHIRKTINIDVLCIKMNMLNQQETNASLCRNMLPLSFYPNTLLKYPYSNFIDYLNNISRKKYRRCMSDKKTLEKQEGRIEIVHNIASIHNEIYDLYTKTSAKAKTKENYIEMPALIDKDFFAQIDQFHTMNPCVATVIVKEKIIAYSLLLQSGKTLFFKAVGLDYQLSYQTKAYFNLFYATLEYASQQQCDKIDFGMTSYQFKQWLGCDLTPASYLCCTFNPLLSLIKKPVVFFMDRKIRSSTGVG